MCVLLLRGPQTPGEIRTRTQRLCQFNDVAEVESALNQLASRDDGPYVVKLEREAGRRESRYAHLLSGEVDVATQTLPQATGGESAPSLHEERIELLEAEVTFLKKEVEDLKLELALLKE